MQWAQYNAAVMARKPHFPWLEVLRMMQHHSHSRGRHWDDAVAQADQLMLILGWWACSGARAGAVCGLGSLRREADVDGHPIGHRHGLRQLESDLDTAVSSDVPCNNLNVETPPHDGSFELRGQ